MEVEHKLTTILEKIKIYKSVKEKEIQTLKKKLANIEKRFKKYKKTKQKELKLLKHQLKRNMHVPISSISSSSSKTVKNSPTITNIIVNNKHSTEKLPWIKITVSDNLNIYDLALKYYGDAQQYEKIYTANQDIIGQDYQIKNGMQLRLPMTESFENAPYILK